MLIFTFTSLYMLSLVSSNYVREEAGEEEEKCQILMLKYRNFEIIVTNSNSFLFFY